MKKLAAILLPLALLGALVVAACGKTPSTGNTTSSGPVTTIYENGSLFVDASGNPSHAATVKVNTPITFSDTIGGGGQHYICVGTSGSTGGGGPNTCQSSGNGPSQFYSNGNSSFSGMPMTAGNKYQITFPNTGTYHVICTVHTGMYVNVTVMS